MEAIALIDSTFDQSEKYFHEELRQEFSQEFSTEAMTRLLKGIRVGMVLGKQEDLTSLYKEHYMDNFKVPEMLQVYPENMTTSR